MYFDLRKGLIIHTGPNDIHHSPIKTMIMEELIKKEMDFTVLTKVDYKTKFGNTVSKLQVHLINI